MSGIPDVPGVEHGAIAPRHQRELSYLRVDELAEARENSLPGPLPSAYLAGSPRAEHDQHGDEGVPRSSASQILIERMRTSSAGVRVGRGSLTSLGSGCRAAIAWINRLVCNYLSICFT